jgi:hypothetical protein
MVSLLDCPEFRLLFPSKVFNLRINAVKPWKKPHFHCVFYAVLCYTCGFHCNFNSLREFYWFPSLLVIVSPWAPCWVWAWSLLKQLTMLELLKCTSWWTDCSCQIRLVFLLLPCCFCSSCCRDSPCKLIREYVPFCLMNQGHWTIPLWANTKIGWPDGGTSNVYDR